VCVCVCVCVYVCVCALHLHSSYVVSATGLVVIIRLQQFSASSSLRRSDELSPPFKLVQDVARQFSLQT